MAALEIIALNTATPQLRAPTTGDTYAAPRTVTITPEANTGALVLTGGTVTALTQVCTQTMTFNNGAVTFIGASNDFTDTASATGTILEQWRVGGVAQVSIRKDGRILGNGANPYLWLDQANGSFLGYGTVTISCGGSIQLTNGSQLSVTPVGVFLSNAVGSLGYGSGSGGAVTQATSRTTGVTLNRGAGAITLVSAAGSPTYSSFTLTNSNILSVNDVVHVTQQSGTDLYQIFVTNTAVGSCKISFATTGGVTTEQPVFNFVVIKGSAS